MCVMHKVGLGSMVRSQVDFQRDILILLEARKVRLSVLTFLLYAVVVSAVLTVAISHIDLDVASLSVW